MRSSRCGRKMCYNYYKTGLQIQLVLFLLFVAAVASASRAHSIEKRSTKCILPPYPEHGFYAIAGDPAAKPGDDAEYVYLNVSCSPFHGVIGNNVVLCILGEWSTKMPECVPVCYLPEHPSVTYSCNRPGAEGFKPCGEYEPSGTSAKPECGPGYYSLAAEPRMRCVDGTWDYVAQCTPECGRLSDNATTLPWYVHISKEERNKKNIVKYQTICGGTIISPNIVISAAHCFWDSVDAKIRTSGYFVVANNHLDAIRDEDNIPVKDVKATDRFHGMETNFQDDIALVILSQAFTYSMKLYPVCLDFDYSFNKKQLQEGNLGTVGVFHFNSRVEETTEHNQSLLQLRRLPYIPIRKCMEIAPPSFRAYFTGDKICAGQKNGTLICIGNSGSGLAFPEDRLGVVRYYLQGVVSTAPRTKENCAPSDFIALTDLYKHKDFIIEHLATSLPPRVMGWQETEDAL